jgi:hypothetical protein
MKKALVAALAASSLAACTSVETTTVSSNEVTALGGAHPGEAIAVIQGTSIGFSLFWYVVDIVQSDLDTAVNKLLVTEAKAMGASKVDLKHAWTTPRSGIFGITGLIIGLPVAQASGIAIK